MKKFDKFEENALINCTQNINHYNETQHLEKTFVDLPENSANFQWAVENVTENLIDFQESVEKVTEHIRSNRVFNLDQEASTVLDRINLLERHSKQYLKLEEFYGSKINFDYEAYDSEGCLPFKSEFYAFLANQFLTDVISILEHDIEMRQSTAGVLVFKLSAVDASNGKITSATLSMENFQLAFGECYDEEYILSGNMFKLLERLTLKILEMAKQESPTNAVVSLLYELELKTADSQDLEHH